MRVFLFITCCLVISTVGASDVEAETSTVTASFMGSSGGMKLFRDESKAFVMIQQGKLEEVSADGSKVLFLIVSCDCVDIYQVFNAYSCDSTI